MGNISFVLENAVGEHIYAAIHLSSLLVQSWHIAVAVGLIPSHPYPAEINLMCSSTARKPLWGRNNNQSSANSLVDHKRVQTYSQKTREVDGQYRVQDGSSGLLDWPRTMTGSSGRNADVMVDFVSGTFESVFPSAVPGSRTNARNGSRWARAGNGTMAITR
ncbi:uncharacterized protein EI97DRAFT_440332 [Westerdykella ornata]|uniref:Uncharacterized protein n=1 Tax=Westerdykella ornata TaxID=318751 RepID=A0A6A6JSU9_WESOR|nr:uncharacterized protein EI97DRAFT_440332 [Westerdykella ornata]KAF2278816.1 hypothetical protein EI97DRAFT_440332 [Westerdykella ornata]